MSSLWFCCLLLFSSCCCSSGLTRTWRRGTTPLSWVSRMFGTNPIKNPQPMEDDEGAAVESRWGRPADRRRQQQQLRWRFPEPPADPVVLKAPAQSPLQQQQPALDRRSVAVRCGESRVQVEVSQDLLGIGLLVRPEEVTLGGCPAAEVDESAHVLVFESELHECGSTLTVGDSGFVYTFQLLYNPRAVGTSPITRSQSTAIQIECLYS